MPDAIPLQGFLSIGSLGFKGLGMHGGSTLGGGAAGAAIDLLVPLNAQAQTNWCWAAVSEGIAKFYDPSSGWTQCEIAEQSLSPQPVGGCCRSPMPAACDTPWYLDRALETVGHLDAQVARPIDVARIEKELNAGQPIGVRVRWGGSGLGHFVIIAGLRRAPSGIHYVRVCDPYGPKSGWIKLVDLASNYDLAQGRWTHTYFTRYSPTGGAGLASTDPDSLGG